MPKPTLGVAFFGARKQQRLHMQALLFSKPRVRGAVHQLAPILRPFNGCTGRAFILKGNLATWALEMSTGVFKM